MFSKGTTITTKILTDWFKYIYRKINGLSNVELRQLTSGQFQWYATSSVSDVMNVWSSQYFDRELCPYTSTTTINYMQWYTLKAEELSVITITGEWS